MIKTRGLYYITHFDNLPSILEKGIFCHRKITEEKHNFKKIYNEEVVDKRKGIILPNGHNLWDYANLYFQPRNPMLFTILLNSEVKNEVLVIGLKSEILNWKDIFVTDGNAAHKETKFFKYYGGGIFVSNNNEKISINTLRKDVNIEYWIENNDSKRKIMAECLVPEKIDSSEISEIYVATRDLADKVKNVVGSKFNVIVEPDMFFMPSRKIKLTDTLFLVEGDMFFSRMQTLTISVNTVGVMGNGIASRAKYQFPDVYVEYQDQYKKKALVMGKPVLYKRTGSLNYLLSDESGSLQELDDSPTWFLLFPTKKHWREMADFTGIENGLKWLVSEYKKQGIKSLAIPALGCGLGGLSWKEIGPLMCSYLRKLDIYVNIYLPLEKKIPEEQLSKEFLIK